MSKNANIIHIKNLKFKNNILDFVIPLNLDEYITHYNLIVNILKNGCKEYQDFTEIKRYLQKMYGAVFSINLSKVGEKIFVEFYIKVIDEKYIICKENLFEKSIKFISDFYSSPYTDEKKFSKQYFKIEKENLKTLIKSKKDDKEQYAIERAIEICYEGENFSRYQYGDLKTLNKIKNKDLVYVWENRLKKIRPYFVSCSNIENEEFGNLVQKYFNSQDYDNIEKKKELFTFKNEFKEVVEEDNVSQGKLVMCLRSKENVIKNSYFSFIVMNSILGGGTYSKLFREIRETHALAYFCYSFIEIFKSLIVIVCGIDNINYLKTKKVCLKQIENIKNGCITTLELKNAKNKIVNDLIALEDSQEMLVNYISTIRIYGINYTIEEIIEGINEVSLKEIIECAKNMNLNTIYFLKAKGE